MNKTLTIDADAYARLVDSHGRLEEALRDWAATFRLDEIPRYVIDAIHGAVHVKPGEGDA